MSEDFNPNDYAHLADNDTEGRPVEAIYSLEAEQSLLGAIIKNPLGWDYLPPDLAAMDFSQRHSRIYSAMQDLINSGKPVDIVTVADALSTTGRDELEYLSDLAVSWSSSANMAAFAEIILKKSLDRKLLNMAQNLIVLAHESGSAEEKIQAVATLSANLERAGGDEGRGINDLLKAAIDAIDHRMRSKELPGLSTGFADLDAITMGLQPSDLVVIAGRPSMGKTAISMNIALNVAQRGGNVLVFSAESTGSSLTDRLLAAASEIPLSRIKKGDLLEDDWVKLEKGARMLKDKGLTINDVSGIHIERLTAICRKRNRIKQLDLIVVDYLQLLTCRAESETVRVANISKALKKVAKQTGAPVIAVAQLNRAVEKQANKRPTMGDLKQSGQIEQDADLILLMYRDEYYNEDSPHKGIAEVIIAKQRDGETGTVRLVSRLDYMKFENLTPYNRPPEPEPENPKQKRFY